MKKNFSVDKDTTVLLTFHIETGIGDHIIKEMNK